MNDVPGARQSRDPACAAAQVDPLQVHHDTPGACAFTGPQIGEYLDSLFDPQKENAMIILQVHKKR